MEHIQADISLTRFLNGAVSENYKGESAEDIIS
jgi:hypothetical protein